MSGAIQAESRMPDPVFDPLDSAAAEEGGYVVYRLAAVSKILARRT
jgi:hypothetical protein